MTEEWIIALEPFAKDPIPDEPEQGEDMPGAANAERR
jgi:hypothetical protein